MSTIPVRVLSVLPLVGHPRDSKRIEMLKEGGFNAEAIAFQRKYHKGRMPNCQTTIIGTLEHGKYFKRLVKMILALPAIRKAIMKNEVIYASGVDMAFISLLAGIGIFRPVIVEIGDIREIQVAVGFSGKLVRWFDRWLTDKCRLLVVTAPAFLNYYRGWLKSNIPAIVIENKLESSLFGNEDYKPQSDNLRPLVDRPLRIGYFGLLRDEWSWLVLKRLAEKGPSTVQIYLAGYPMINVDFDNEAKKQPNIYYLGQYKSPQDLPRLYNMVDLVWACYPPIKSQDMNLKWARPNRFYESCFFNKPLISRYGSQDSVDIDRFQIGKIVMDNDVEDVADKLLEITVEQIDQWRKNFEYLPRAIYLYTNETIELKTAIDDILQKPS